jgi:hypothetical protein
MAVSLPTSTPAAAKSVREDEAAHSIAKTVDGETEDSDRVAVLKHDVEQDGIRQD